MTDQFVSSNDDALDLDAMLARARTARGERYLAAGYVPKLASDVEQLIARVRDLQTRMPREPFDVRCADALADEVAVLIRRKVIDARSPAADALLDYREPPYTPRSDRLAALDAQVAAKDAEIERLRRVVNGALESANNIYVSEDYIMCDACGARWQPNADETHKPDCWHAIWTRWEATYSEKGDQQ